MENQLWSALITPIPTTENGAPTYSTSGSAMVDLFFKLGSCRGAPDEQIILVFSNAYAENPELALKALFYARDIRQGQGERNFFNVCAKWVAQNHPTAMLKNIPLIPVYGRWDDLLHLLDTPVQAHAIEHFAIGIFNGIGLACKWAPREKSNRRAAALLRNKLGFSPKKYRQHISEFTDVVESKMCKNLWEEIDFNRVPSRAMKIYSNAFQRQSKNYSAWLAELVDGKAKVNASTLYPYEIVQKLNHSDESTRLLCERMWESLPEYFDSQELSILPIIDVSGSMMEYISTSTMVSCMDVAISLGMYCAERTRGPFKDKFITFSEKPHFVSIPPGSLTEKYYSIKSADWGMNTNFERVFHEILLTAKLNHVDPANMPDMLLCISDMEFDCSVSDTNTNFEAIKNMYRNSGYKMPKLVFWNVQSRTSGNYPVSYTEDGVALVSGFSPHLMKAVLSADDFTPQSIMLNTLNSDRYSAVCI